MWLQVLEELGLDAADLVEDLSLSISSSRDEEKNDASCIEESPSWKSAPLPDATPGRRRNVARLRAMGGDPTCVPPNFNSTMLAIWEELWHSMPQSGKISVTVNSLLQQYIQGAL